MPGIGSVLGKVVIKKSLSYAIIKTNNLGNEEDLSLGEEGEEEEESGEGVRRGPRKEAGK